MAVAYRTNLTLGSDPLNRDSSLISAGNRYLSDLSPKHNRNLNKTGEKKKVDLTKPMRLGAFVDLNTIQTPYIDENNLLPEIPQFSWLLPKSKEESTESEKLSSSPTTADTTKGSNSTITGANNNTTMKIPEKASISPVAVSSSAPTLRESIRRSSSSRLSLKTLPEPKPLKPMCYPFATEKTKSTELAEFYIKCINEPRLSQLQQKRTEEEGDLVSSSEESVEDISETLKRFEESRKKFDDLEKYFKEDEEENNDDSDGNSNS